MPQKAIVYLYILRWVLALVFFANGVPKLSDPGFGADAEQFFATLNDDVIIKPYKIVLNDFVIPNAHIVASLIKYGEIALGISFFLGWPLRLTAICATFLHLNYLAIASFPTFIYLNILMIAVEWACVHVFEKDK
jgi:uncharacterized membrane protein YphA (DoxX/SURF4 family)